jgi:prolyl-tRNA editing enzyme YbaK/EbsC (Cys-tRNA(Pro) deacylase)
MSELDARVLAVLLRSGQPFEAMACDPALADTETFCARYGQSLSHSANTIVVRSKTGEARYAACVVLATMRLDVNHIVRKRLGARKVSFASAEETQALTGMSLGGVTAFALPETLPLWIDARIMALDYVILGGGNRSSKIKLAPAVFDSIPNAEIVDGLARPAATVLPPVGRRN